MEVRYSGTVTTPPRFFYGSHSHMDHEQFDVRRDPDAGGGLFRVIDNVSIGPRVPVKPGDRVAVKGELVNGRGKLPIVHFTHHDPWGTHEDGSIEVGGRIYA